jgi:hypothetical protein
MKLFVPLFGSTQNSAKYTEIPNSYEETGSSNSKLQNEAVDIKTYVESLKDNYTAFEKDLAQLESRPVKDLSFLRYYPQPRGKLVLGIREKVR